MTGTAVVLMAVTSSSDDSSLGEAVEGDGEGSANSMFLRGDQPVGRRLLNT